ncbi:MAG: DUF5591 domain-containing protein [Ferroplasma sp.]
MPVKIKDMQYTFCFSRSGYVDNLKIPALINTFSGDYYNSNYIEVMGEKFEKNIYYPTFLNGEKIVEGNKIIIIFNGMELIQRPAKLVDFVVGLRLKYGFKKLFYLQGVSDPYIIPVLVYLGIDLFDDIYIRKESADGIKYNFLGKSKTGDDPLIDNIGFVSAILNSLYDSIKNGTLRDVVEKISISGKALEILRIIDLKYNKEYGKVFPSRTPYIQANSIEALDRPDIALYRNKIEIYKKPAGRNIALLLPCSAKKPYSQSKSHMKILSEILQYRKYLHELIVTSPVGLVPRELEYGYPARYYDIPVIGVWYEDEKTMMKNLISRYLNNNDYSHVIAYIPEDLSFIEEVLPPSSTIIEGRVTAPENLAKLREALASIIQKDSQKGNNIDDYRALLRFQFGEWINKYLDNMNLINNFHQNMLVRKNKLLFIFNEKTGRFSITPESAKFFLENNKFNVGIDNFMPTSNVYAIGVQNATDDIRPYDEVIMTYNNELRGTGTAMMSYKAMVDLDAGVAIKVRKGIKD